MTVAVFETAVLADALRKAAAFAPTAAAGDHAFGSAAGIVIEIRPDGAGGGTVRVRSTNLETFFETWIAALSLDGPAALWRVSSQMITGIVSALPSGPGKQVELRDDYPWLHLRTDATRAQVITLDGHHYPQWSPYDPVDHQEVDGLGELISRVSWACDGELDPFTGVYFDGAIAMACNQRRAATVPCPIPLLHGRGAITVPAKAAGMIIKQAGAARVGMVDNHLTISQDPFTQIRCTLFDKCIPSPRKLLARTYDAAVTLDKRALAAVVKRMLNIAAGSGEITIAHVVIGGGQMLLRIAGGEKGESIEERIALPAGEGAHLPVLLKFMPRVFLDAVTRGPDPTIELRYNASGTANEAVRIDCGEGYLAWFVQWKGLD